MLWFKKIRATGTLDSQTVLLLVFLGVLVVLISVLTQGRILHARSLQALAFQLPVLGLLVLAQLAPMLTGGIDLSLISTANLAGIQAALILTSFSGWYAVPLAIIAGLVTAVMVGIFNGAVVSGIRVPPFIVTLGTMILVRGIALSITKGRVIAGFPREFLFLGGNTLAGVPMPFLIFLACALFLAVLLKQTAFGISTYMLGSNLIATTFSGVKTSSSLLRTYVLSGSLAGVAGVIMASRFNAVQADFGGAYLLLTVLACVLGGVNPAGGFGKVSVVLIAIIILQITATGFTLLGLSAHLANALWGIILLSSIGIKRAVSVRGAEIK